MENKTNANYTYQIIGLKELRNKIISGSLDYSNLHVINMETKEVKQLGSQSHFTGLGMINFLAGDYVTEINNVVNGNLIYVEKNQKK